MKNFCLYLLLYSFYSVAVHADSDWMIASEHTRQLIHKMDEAINIPDRDEAYKRYMETFSPDIQAFGLYESGPANLELVKQQYTPVFEFFEDGILVTEKLIVTGSRAAQRYHSMFKLNGTFDGVTYDGKLTVIRGVTFFEFDNNDQIIRRWSNHDHAYRMEQLQGEKGYEEGVEISKILNGPGLSANEVHSKINHLEESFNLIHNPQLRREQVLEIFDKEVKIEGIEHGGSDYQALVEYFDNVWTAFPDLVVSQSGTMSAWAYGATALTGLGSNREKFYNFEADKASIKLTLELIMHFNNDGKIDEFFLYQHPLK